MRIFWAGTHARPLWFTLLRQMNRSRSFYIVSLGCPKNLVDSEGMAALLGQAGYNAASAPEGADLIVVNTCGFIEPARMEAIDELRKLAERKRLGQRLVAAGCYSQRHPHELLEQVPGIDGLIGTRHWMDLPTLVEQMDWREDMPPGGEPLCHIPEKAAVRRDVPGIHRAAIQGGSAYLRLSDGCSRSCAFCAIPLIKGPAVSRPLAGVLDDAAWLADSGISEIILVAQDTTSYGHDLGMHEGLATLLEQLVSRVPSVPWIRLMYLYPTRLTERLIDVMASHPQILPYVDLPLQHAHPDVLRRMRRPANVEAIRRKLSQLRKMMPEIAIRTTCLVGFPGETEEEFQSLPEFVAEMEFDRVGAFAYSHEEGTPAAALHDDVPESVKEERRERLLEIQQPISLAKNETLIGQTLDVLIEGRGDDLSVGRSYRDAPEIDGLILVRAELAVGQIRRVYISAALEYDLIGEPSEEPG